MGWVIGQIFKIYTPSKISSSKIPKNWFKFLFCMKNAKYFKEICACLMFQSYIKVKCIFCNSI